MEQWENLYEYSLAFLLEQKNFKNTVAKTLRFERIEKALSDVFTKVYLAFCVFDSPAFERFLLTFQSGHVRLIYYILRCHS